MGGYVRGGICINGGEGGGKKGGALNTLRAENLYRSVEVGVAQVVVQVRELRAQRARRVMLLPALSAAHGV